MASKRKRRSGHHLINRKLALEKYPPLLRQLLEKHGGNLLAASRAVGRASGYWIGRMANNPTHFNEKAQEIVRRALAGESVAVQGSATPRKAILIVKSERFEQLYDIAQTMGGEWLMKRKAGPEWIGVLKMQGNDLDAFLALARAKGAESHVT